jgi:hypothetical protein
MMDSQSDNQSSESVWNHKPWWCQPWSILLTGLALIGGSWFLLKTIWITVLVAVPILIWMGFFLLVYPRLMRQSGILEALQSGTE